MSILGRTVIQTDRVNSAYGFTSILTSRIPRYSTENFFYSTDRLDMVLSHLSHKIHFGTRGALVQLNNPCQCRICRLGHCITPSRTARQHINFICSSAEYTATQASARSHHDYRAWSALDNLWSATRWSVPQMIYNHCLVRRHIRPACM
jgi:hypothetical protein